jgi:MFS transporter, ACS family, glucarate transporter
MFRRGKQGAPVVKDWLVCESTGRWGALSLLTIFSIVGYVERVNLSVAGRFIRDDFDVTDREIGWAFSIFLLSYTIAQVPSGILIDRFGPRRILVAAGLAWFGVTTLMAWLVGYVAQSASQVIVTLLACRFLLGLAEAPTYPAAAAIIARWFAPTKRGLPNAIVQGAAFTGEALTLIVMASLTNIVGWRPSLALSALPALLAALAWWRWGSDMPCRADSARTERRDNVGEAAAALATSGASPAPFKRAVAALSAGYFLHGYVAYLFFFWFYTYLVDARHFTVAGGGIVGALPIISAALCALVGGRLSDMAASRHNPVRGRQSLVLVAGFVGAGSILVGAFSNDAIWAIGGFIVAVGTRGLVEAAFWSTLNDVAGRRSGLAGGIMNAACNLGGAASTLVAPLLVSGLGWSGAMAVAAIASACTGVALLGLPGTFARSPSRAPQSIAV